MAKMTEETSENANPPQPVSRPEAVRLALAAGIEDPREGTAYILKQYGLEVSLSYFSAVAATERKKGWTKKGKPGRKPKASKEPASGGLNFQPSGHDEDDETEADDD